MHRYQQQDFSFALPAESPAARQGVVNCGSPVASITHRLLGAAADLALVIIGAGLLISIYHLGGGPVPPAKLIPIFYNGLFGMVWLLFESLWAIAGGDTPGAVWAGLRLTGFGGSRPTPRQRLLRLGVKCLGLLAGGLGILWALFDEEQLTWHDHVSNTFHAPRC